MRQSIIQRTLKQLVCIILSLIVIMPFYMVVINSFKDKGESARMSLALPTEWHFENYSVVIEQGKLLQGFSNSMLY
ncbi:MAG: carbohydrate ABC transporter permease, partial [Eubacteriales bacterium]|nr:carbohydrate ABC transporter permease [Eubacteriales bacterium]